MKTYTSEELHTIAKALDEGLYGISKFSGVDRNVKAAVTALFDLARRLKAEEESSSAIGVATAMPGTTEGFTMAIFTASNVPVGSLLYLHPSKEA